MFNGNAILAGLFYDVYSYSALAAMLSLETLFFGFTIGYSAVITSDLSKLIILKEIEQAKKYIIVSNIIVISISAVVFISLIVFKEYLVHFLINSEGSQKVLRELVWGFSFYVVSFLYANIMIGVCKVIRKERIMTKVMIFLNVFVNFGLMALMIYLGCNVSSILWAMFTVNSCVGLAEVIVIYQTDLDKEADLIIKQMQ